METKEFEMILQVVATGLVEKIIVETGYDEDTAIEKLYTSELYSMLEREKTKVWYYSVHKLSDLWDKEMKTGKLVLPAF